MAKISELPAAEALSGSELIPMTQGGQARQVPALELRKLFADIAARLTTDGAPALLSLLASDGSGVDVIDNEGFVVPDRLRTPPAHPDRVLADLIGLGEWRGPWIAEEGYAVGAVVQRGMRFFFALQGHGNSTAAPETAPTIWAEIPLVGDERFAMDDSFTADPGAFIGRPIEQGQTGLVWGADAAGNLSAVVDAAGYATSAANTYFTLGGLRGTLTEYGAVVWANYDSFTQTMAVSPEAFFDFDEMVHVNFYEQGGNSTLYWHAGVEGLSPPLRYRWSGGQQLEKNRPNECVLKFRARWIFGYINGLLTFAECADLYETLSGSGAVHSIYFQNHTLTLGDQRHLHAWVKVAAA